MSWGATISFGVYSGTHIYVLGLTFATEAEARGAAQALIDKILALMDEARTKDTAEAEWAAGEAIDALLGEKPHPYFHSSYSDRNWRVDVAELTTSPWRVR
jgi:hypothetical protein